jgi:hypothetical protein
LSFSKIFDEKFSRFVEKFDVIIRLHNTGASIAKSSFKTVPGVGLDLSASGVYVAFTGNWHYRKTHWYTSFIIVHYNSGQ